MGSRRSQPTLQRHEGAPRMTPAERLQLIRDASRRVTGGDPDPRPMRRPPPKKRRRGPQPMVLGRSTGQQHPALPGWRFRVLQG